MQVTLSLRLHRPMQMLLAPRSSIAAGERNLPRPPVARRDLRLPPPFVSAFEHSSGFASVTFMDWLRRGRAGQTARESGTLVLGFGTAVTAGPAPMWPWGPPTRVERVRSSSAQARRRLRPQTNVSAPRRGIACVRPRPASSTSGSSGARREIKCDARARHCA